VAVDGVAGAVEHQFAGYIHELFRAAGLQTEAMMSVLARHHVATGQQWGHRVGGDIERRPTVGAAIGQPSGPPRFSEVDRQSVVGGDAIPLDLRPETPAMVTLTTK
jgi:hypothetical protein